MSTVSKASSEEPAIPASPPATPAKASVEESAPRPVRSATKQNSTRRRRSRSPGEFLKKKSNSIRGFLKGQSKKKSGDGLADVSFDALGDEDEFADDAPVSSQGGESVLQGAMEDEGAVFEVKINSAEVSRVVTSSKAVVPEVVKPPVNDFKSTDEDVKEEKKVAHPEPPQSVVKEEKTSKAEAAPLESPQSAEKTSKAEAAAVPVIKKKKKAPDPKMEERNKAEVKKKETVEKKTQKKETIVKDVPAPVLLKEKTVSTAPTLTEVKKKETVEKDSQKKETIIKDVPAPVLLKEKTVSTESTLSSGSTVETTEMTASSIPMKESAVYPIQIILVVMDPVSRRFELLQLEFDSPKVLVMDILGQISLSATEIRLRSKEYCNVCSREGVSLKDEEGMVDLEQFMVIGDTKTVLLAVPEGMSSNKCAKLARPILKDSTVVAIIDPDSELSLPSTPEEINISITKQLTTDDIIAPTKSEPVTTDKLQNTSFLKYMLLFSFLILFVSPITIKVHKRMSQPLSPGDTLKAGQWRSQCGLYSAVPQQVWTSRAVALFPQEWISKMHNTLCPSPSYIIQLGENGILTLSEEGQSSQSLWELETSACGACGGESEDDISCGVTIEDDGMVLIAGLPAKYFGKDPMVTNPWPFTVSPPVKKMKGKRKKGWKQNCPAAL